ncbi:LOW QUALITY PROTEIN: ankyrin and armadillo repeat-containing protein [Pluvialis apricaria]
MNASSGGREYRALGKIAREIHQILELAVGICCPSIGSDANYHHSTSCQIPPADKEIGQILISVDYMQRLALQQNLLKKLEKVTAICRNIEYLMLMNSDSIFTGVQKEAAHRTPGYKAQLCDLDMPGREQYPIPVMEFDCKR